jgi:hypothetical protein
LWLPSDSNLLQGVDIGLRKFKPLSSREDSVQIARPGFAIECEGFDVGDCFDAPVANSYFDEFPAVEASPDPLEFVERFKMVWRDLPEATPDVAT